MISIEDAQAIIKSHIIVKKEELRKTYTSTNYVLAEDVYANYPSPYFDNSAMDGYAISMEDTEAFLQNDVQIKEKVLEVIGISSAGHPFEGRLSLGKCIQINTGAKIPENTGAIIPLEDIKMIEPNKIQIQTIKKKYQNIRKKGEDFNEGQLLLKKGTILNPRAIVLLLQSGKYEVFVYKKPRILLITTGSELISYKDILLEEDMNKGKIINTTAYLLQSILQEKQYEYIIYENIKDEEDEIYKILLKHKDVDFIIITGGVSVGPYDFVKKDVEKAGFKTLFWKINQKPGKPMYCAINNHQQILFGLPGNPVSSFMNFQHYVLPAIYYFETSIWKHISIDLISLSEIKNSGSRDSFYTIKIIDNKYFEILPKEGSHLISLIAKGDGYIIIPSNHGIKQNESYQCFLWM